MQYQPTFSEFNDTPQQPTFTDNIHSTTFNPNLDSYEYLFDFNMSLPGSSKVNESEMQRLHSEINRATSALDHIENPTTFDSELSIPSSYSDDWGYLPQPSMSTSSFIPYPDITLAAPDAPVEWKGVGNKRTKGKPVMCGICNKVFSRKYGLDSHMVTHSLVRAFKCKTCPDTFKRSHDFKRHVKTCESKQSRRVAYC
jgi:hypothetical protein